MKTPLERAALAVARLACRLLPAGLRDWGNAMVQEVAAIDHPVAALRFAFGCLGFALRQTMAFYFRALAGVPRTEEKSMHDAAFRPGFAIALCGGAATSLGLAYLVIAGAPVRYVAMHAGSLAMGLLAVGLAIQVARLARIPAGAVVAGLGAILVLTALFGAAVDGASRWVVLAGVSVQPSLLVVPIMAIGFARSRDGLSTAGILLAALALALQPDRAMAGALVAGMVALVLVRPDRKVLTVLAAALGAFVVTLVRPDSLPATPFVDGVLQSAFAAHPGAGLAVWTGAALLLLPPLLGLYLDSTNRMVWIVFGALWLAVLIAALLGNYPTPLVGYGGSAIVGYMLCMLGVTAQRDTARSRPGVQAGAGGPANGVMPRIGAIGG